MNQPTDVTMTWEPISIFSSKPLCGRFALVILNRALTLPLAFYTKLWYNAIYKVAADGGANRLHTLNNSSSSLSNDFDPDLVIGDLDSLLPQVRAYLEEKKVPIIHDPDQDTTDLTKAIKYIQRNISENFLDIVILGDISGRVDQGMSVLNHLFTLQEKSTAASGRLFLLSGDSVTFMLQCGNHLIKTRQSFKNLRLGKYVGIIPLKEPSIISTSGLEWDVKNWETKVGGQMSTSNHVKSDSVLIKTTKDVLFTVNLDIDE